MALNLQNLSVLAYANGFTLWHYRTELEAAELCADESLDPASDLIRPGDLIIASGGRAASADLLVVNVITGGGIAARPFGSDPPRCTCRP